MEPYNPNKPFLEFKFDKEKAKEELRNTIPGLRALEYYHQNPDSSITNSLDILAEDFVPFYANTKYGGDVGDYVKEAMLLGLFKWPDLNLPSTSKSFINRNKDLKYYNSNQNLYYKDKNGKLQSISKDYFPEPDLDNIREYSDYKSALDDITRTEQAYDKAKPIMDKSSDIIHGMNSYKEIEGFNKEFPNVKVDYIGGPGSDPAVLSYNPKTKQYDVYDKDYYGWHNAGYGFGTEYTADPVFLESKRWYKNDPIERGKVERQFKELRNEVNEFNLDERWSNEFDFNDMKLSNPWTWKYGE